MVGSYEYDSHLGFFTQEKLVGSWLLCFMQKSGKIHKLPLYTLLFFPKIVISCTVTRTWSLLLAREFYGIIFKSCVQGYRIKKSHGSLPCQIFGKLVNKKCIDISRQGHSNFSSVILDQVHLSRYMVI
jgi:hypothetical protein